MSVRPISPEQVAKNRAKADRVWRKKKFTGCHHYLLQSEHFVLRKNKSFNKSRYARIRQLARVIFYFSLYINILVIFGIFHVFYGFTLYAGFIWWGLGLTYLTTIASFFFKNYK